MILSAEEIHEQKLCLARRDGEYTEPQIDDVNRAAFVEIPPMANICRHRHLSRR